MIEHRFTNSSAIDWCKYDPGSKELEVCFQSGSAYRYSNVPVDLVRGLCQAPSAGRFFHAYIAHAFPYSSGNQSAFSLSVHREMSAPPRSGKRFYTTADKMPFSQELSTFETFRQYIVEYCATTGADIATFNQFLKKDKKCKLLKSKARAEFQSIYIAVAIEVGLPKLSVFLPTRKKVSVMGLARTVSGTPDEIRLYTIHGPSHKAYSSWMARDMRIDDSSSACETLLHEIAHIHEAHCHRILGHDESFIEGYLKAEQIFIQLGFEPLLTIENRFTGCPQGSKAAKLAGSRR